MNQDIRIGDKVLDIFTNEEIHVVTSDKDPYGSDEPSLLMICGKLGLRSHITKAESDSVACPFCESNKIDPDMLSPALAKILNVNYDTGEPLS